MSTMQTLRQTRAAVRKQYGIRGVRPCELRLHRNGDIEGKGFNPAWDEEPVAPWDRDDEVVYGDESAHPKDQDLFGAEDAMIEAVDGAKTDETREADDFNRMINSHYATEEAVEDGAFDVDYDHKGENEMTEYYEQMAERIGVNDVNSPPEVCRPVCKMISLHKATEVDNWEPRYWRHKGTDRSWKTGLPTREYPPMIASNGHVFIPNQGSAGSCSAAYHAAGSRRRAAHQWAKNKPSHARYSVPADSFTYPKP